MGWHNYGHNRSIYRSTSSVNYTLQGIGISII